MLSEALAVYGRVTKQKNVRSIQREFQCTSNRFCIQALCALQKLDAARILYLVACRRETRENINSAENEIRVGL